MSTPYIFLNKQNFTFLLFDDFDLHVLEKTQFQLLPWQPRNNIGNGSDEKYKL